MYPITGGPLFVAGFIQVNSIDVGDMSTAASDVGVLGTMSSRGSEFDSGFALSSIEKVLKPSSFIA